MTPTDLLREEHRLIERVLAALEVFIKRMESEGELDREDLGKFATFIQGFADTRHHGKEEKILFEAMIEDGFSREAGPVAVMLADHEDGRANVRILVAEAGSPAPDKARIAAAGRAFTAMLLPHIQKEDNILYRMAEMHLGPESMAKVTADVERFESGEASIKERAKFLALAEELARKYSPGAAA